MVTSARLAQHPLPLLQRYVWGQLTLEKREKYAQMGFLFTEASAPGCCIIRRRTCGLERHTSLNNYITVRGTQMVKLDHEYDYEPVLLFKYESHSHLGYLLRQKEGNCR